MTTVANHLTDEQRQEAFARALETERALKELPTLKAQLLAALDKQEATWRAEHTRLMHAATTGESATEPQQQGLPFAAPSSAAAAPAARTPEDETPPPKPPNSKPRKRSRKDSSAKAGAKRAEVSARVASEPQPAANRAAADDVVPPPRIPCCSCTHSIADHSEGSGPCVRCECKSFTPVPVALPGFPGWSVAPAADGARVLMGMGKTSLPLTWMPGYGLAFRNGGAWSHVVCYLGTSTLVHLKDPRWKWVPLEVLRALAEQLGAQWPTKTPESVGVSSEQAPEPSETIPELDDPFTTQATDGKAASEFKALDLSALHPVLGKPSGGEHRTYLVRVVGNSPRACESCGTRERPRAWLSFSCEDRKQKRGEYTGGGSFGMALCLEHCTIDGVKRADRNRYHRAEQERLARMRADETPAASEDSTPCECDNCGETFKASELQPVGVGEGRAFYCPACRDAVEDTSPTASVSSLPVEGSPAEPLASAPSAPPTTVFGEPWPTLDEQRFPGWYVHVTPGLCGKPDSITARRFHELFHWLDVARPDGSQVTSLGWYPAAKDGPRVLVTDFTEPSSALDTLLPAGLYGALVEYLTAHWPLPDELTRAPSADQAPVTTKKPRSRAKAKKSPTPAESTPEPAQADLLTKSAAIEPDSWRVELQGQGDPRIQRVWLVNDATGERKPATWWGTSSALKCSHHLSGKLEGEALAAHLELQAWWKANLESVVQPLSLAIQEGRVPGLKVYEPELLGDGPYTYALSNGWSMDVWDKGDEPYVEFVGPTERSDMRVRVGPFRRDRELLTTGDVAAISWSADHEEVVREAEDFMVRGFIHELRKGATP